MSCWTETSLGRSSGVICSGGARGWSKTASPSGDRHDKHKHKDEFKPKDNRKERDNSSTNERSVSKDAKRRSSEDAKSTDNAAKKYASFDKLMDGVTFVISGFQNPLR